MDKYTIDETQYKNGYRKGYEDGKRDAVKHGRWIRVHEWCGVEVYRCSACGREHPRLKTAYCCDCGARMDGAEDG